MKDKKEEILLALESNQYHAEAINREKQIEVLEDIFDTYEFAKLSKWGKFKMRLKVAFYGFIENF